MNNLNVIDASKILDPDELLRFIIEHRCFFNKLDEPIDSVLVDFNTLHKTELYRSKLYLSLCDNPVILGIKVKFIDSTEELPKG